MKGMRIAYTKPRGATINPNEWEGVLGRLDVLADEINRVPHRATRIEEPRSTIKIARPPKES